MNVVLVFCALELTHLLGEGMGFGRAGKLETILADLLQSSTCCDYGGRQH